MSEALEQFNRGLPTNSKVTICDTREPWIRLSPLQAQPEPEHLGKLKEELHRRWATIPLLDILKETEFRLQFTRHFRGQVIEKSWMPLTSRNAYCCVCML